MKNIHFIGFVIWFLASFFSFKIFILLLNWFYNLGVVLKIILVIITSAILLIGIYKIILSLFLLVNKTHQKFNDIATTFSIIGAIGLISAYLYYRFNLKLDKIGIFGQSLTFTFGFLIALMLVNGFVLFPKSLRGF